jgi:hypothetical protein
MVACDQCHRDFERRVVPMQEAAKVDRKERRYHRPRIELLRLWPRGLRTKIWLQSQCVSH